MATSLFDINAEIRKNEEQLVQLRKQAQEFRDQEITVVIDDL